MSNKPKETHDEIEPYPTDEELFNEEQEALDSVLGENEDPFDYFYDENELQFLP